MKIGFKYRIDDRHMKEHQTMTLVRFADNQRKAKYLHFDPLIKKRIIYTIYPHTFTFFGAGEDPMIPLQIGNASYGVVIK